MNEPQGPNQPPALDDADQQSALHSPTTSPPKRLDESNSGLVDESMVNQYGPFLIYTLLAVCFLLPAFRPSMRPASCAFALGFLANISLLTAWRAQPLGQRLAIYFATVLPVACILFVVQIVDTQHPPLIQPTTLPLLMLCGLVPFLFLQLVTNKKIRFVDSELSIEEKTRLINNQFTIAHFMGFTLATGFAFAVFQAGDHEQRGAAWELLPVTGVVAIFMLYAVFADLVLTLKKPLILGLGATIVLLIGQYLLVRRGIIPNSSLIPVSTFAIALFIPLVVLHRLGGRWGPLEKLPPPPQPKRPIQRLD